MTDEPTPDEIKARFIKARLVLRLRARIKELLDQQREIEDAARAAQQAAYDLRGSYMMIGSQIAEICREFDIAVGFDDYSDDDGLTLVEVFHAEDAHYALEEAGNWAEFTRVEGLEAILADKDADADTIKRALIDTYGLHEDWALRARLADALWDPSKLPPEPPEPPGTSVVDIRQWRRRKRKT